MLRLRATDDQKGFAPASVRPFGEAHVKFQNANSHVSTPGTGHYDRRLHWVLVYISSLSLLATFGPWHQGLEFCPSWTSTHMRRYASLSLALLTTLPWVALSLDDLPSTWPHDYPGKPSGDFSPQWQACEYSLSSRTWTLCAYAHYLTHLMAQILR